MKHFFLLLCLAVTAGLPAAAQQLTNGSADNIVGNYIGRQNGDCFKVRVTRLADGTYRAQVYWVERDCDESGRKILDSKNPDRSLRQTPYDQIVLFNGLKYNAKDKCWDGTKIYDPQRGIRANMRADFTPKGNLRIRGSLLGISETIYWQRIP